MELESFKHKPIIFERADTILYRINQNNFKVLKSRDLTLNDSRYITGVPTNDR